MQTSDSPKIVLTDFDDVLTFSSYKQFRITMFDRFDFFREYFRDLTEEERENFKQLVLNRKTYYFDEFKIKPIDRMYLNEINRIYSDKGFYKDLEPTLLAKSFMLGLNKGIIDRLIVVTKNLSKEQDRNKLEWLMEHFYDYRNKVEVLSCDFLRKQSKSDILNEYKYNFDSYAEDNLDNIIDVIKNIPLTKSFGREIIIPSFGHNIPTNEFDNMILDYNLNVFYQDNWV